MNTPGINAQILYCSNPENSELFRKDFLKNLALSSMKPHHIDTARIKSLPSDISAFLCSEYQTPTENEDTPQELKKAKCGRCLCSRAKDVSTTIIH
jgi:hypothetical protein